MDYIDNGNPSYERPSIEEIKADRQKLKTKAMSNFNELFLTYELSAIAKDKGFNEPCLYYFQDDESLVRLQFGDMCSNKSLTDLEGINIAAPLYQQIIFWLLKILHNKIHIHYYSDESGAWRIGSDEEIYFDNMNEAIEKGLNLIKK